MLRKARRIATYSKGGDRLDNTYYDTKVLVSTTTKYDFFSSPIGSGTPAKTKADTNMTDGGQFPTGKQFRVKEIGMRLTDRKANGVLSDDTRLNLFLAELAQADLTFLIVGKQDLGNWPVSELLPPQSFVHKATTAGDFSIAPTTTYMPLSKKLKIPINLDQRVRFSIQLEFNNGLNALANDIAIQLYIKGIEQRRK